jgi:hypothetical protein
MNLDRIKPVPKTGQEKLYKRSQHSITLKSLRDLTQAIPYDKLKETIIDRHKANKQEDCTLT